MMAFIGENGTRVVVNENLAQGHLRFWIDRRGTVESQLGMLCTVKWDDGTTSEINAYYLDEDKVCPLCKEHYGDHGICDQGKPVASPHRK
jgi:hypothetical protein